jgi:hypothetical protein
MTAIYTRNSDNEAWKFNQVADPIMAQLAADLVMDPTEQVLLITSNEDKFPEFVDACQSEGKAVVRAR